MAPRLDFRISDTLNPSRRPRSAGIPGISHNRYPGWEHSSVRGPAVLSSSFLGGGDSFPLLFLPLQYYYGDTVNGQVLAPISNQGPGYVVGPVLEGLLRELGPSGVEVLLGVHLDYEFQDLDDNSPSFLSFSLTA